MFCPGILVLFYFFHPSYATLKPNHPVLLNKCCLINQRFALGIDNVLQCVTFEKEVKQPDWWWIPKHVMVYANNTTTRKISDVQKVLSSTLGNHSVLYGSKPNCKNNSKDILFNNSKKKKHEFNFIVSDGAIYLKVFKASSYHGVAHRTMFPSKDYCVDVGPDMFVVYLCPCDTMGCVRKCCDEMQAYNETAGVCQNVSQVPDWLPGVSRKTDAKDDTEYYRMVNAKKKFHCQESTVHVVKDVRAKFTLNEDGSLQAKDTERIFPPHEVCVDHTVHRDEMVHYCQHHDDYYFMFGFVFKSFALICLIISIVVLVGAHIRYIYDNCMCCSF